MPEKNVTLFGQGFWHGDEIFCRGVTFRAAFLPSSLAACWRSTGSMQHLKSPRCDRCFSTANRRFFSAEKQVVARRIFQTPRNMDIQSEIAVALKAKHALCFAPLP